MPRKVKTSYNREEQGNLKWKKWKKSIISLQNVCWFKLKLIQVINKLDKLNPITFLFEPIVTCSVKIPWLTSQASWILLA